MKHSATILGMVYLLGGMVSSLSALRAQDDGTSSAFKVETVRSQSENDAFRRTVPAHWLLSKGITKGKQTVKPSVAVDASAARPAVARKSVKAEAVKPPFFCGFDYARELDEKWLIVDGDGDGDAWEYGTSDDYVTFDGGDESGFVMASYVLVEAPEDYLITKAPISLNAGAAYVAFHYAALGGGYTERLRVYYGTSAEADVSEMTLLDEIEIAEADWQFKAIAFEVEEAGDYYFCFLHCSDPDQYNVYLDNIEIGEGQFVGVPDLAVSRVLLPLSSCALGDAEQIGMVVKNTGTAAATKMSLSYKIGEVEVAETYEDRIEPGASEILYFDQRADFSVEDQVYAVTVGVAVEESEGEAEEDTADNTGTGQVRHFTPVTALPFEAVVEENSTMLGYDPAIWIYNPYEGGVVSGIEAEPVVTRCMYLEAGETYRYTYAYLAGIYLPFMEITDDFDVVCGRAGTPVSDWKVLKSHTKVYTQDVILDGEVLYTNEEAGNYSFGIVPKVGTYGYNGTLLLGRMWVEKVAAHDVKIATVLPSIGVRTPARHAADIHFDVVVANRGANDESGVNVTLRHDDGIMYETKPTVIKRGESAYCSLDGSLSALKPNQEVALTFEAGMTATDENPSDNGRTWAFVATDGLYAFDDVTRTDYEDGLGTKEFIFGQVFPLLVDDTLEAVEFGWFDLSAYINQRFEVGVEVYALDEFDKAGDCLLSYEFSRQLSGVQRVEVPACPLRKGRYLVAVKQLASQNIAIGYDEAPEGLFYAMTPGRNARVSPITAYGNVAVRAVFGGGKVANEPRTDLSAYVQSYPNPVSGQWTVETKGVTIHRVEISDVAGHTVYRSADMVSETHGVDMGGLAPGLYVARIHTDAGVHAVKVTVR